MIRHSIFFAVVAMNVSTIPALASQCATANEIAASFTRWATVRRQSVNAANRDFACRAFAASFYESVATRQAAAVCAHDADHDRHISAIDSEIDAFNDLLAAKCGS
jgi:hypothetical protein